MPLPATAYSPSASLHGHSGGRVFVISMAVCIVRHTGVSLRFTPPRHDVDVPPQRLRTFDVHVGLVFVFVYSKKFAMHTRAHVLLPTCSLSKAHLCMTTCKQTHTGIRMTYITFVCLSIKWVQEAGVSCPFFFLEAWMHPTPLDFFSKLSVGQKN